MLNITVSVEQFGNLSKSEKGKQREWESSKSTLLTTHETLQNSRGIQVTYKKEFYLIHNEN